MVKHPRNAEYTKEYNQKAVLRLLRREALSRAELARRLGLSRAAASVIADELLQVGMVIETAPQAAGVGRAPTPLTLSPDAGYAVGVYLNRGECRIGIVGMDGRILLQEQPELEGSRDAVEDLICAVQALLQKAALPQKTIGIGISAPGPLDGERGLILDPPRFEQWQNADLHRLHHALHLPVYLENNASSLARYHQNRPEAGGSENFLLLLVNSGIGSGVVLGGKLLKGAGFFTSELGHISIDLHGRPCPCGNCGCLETYAAIPRLLEGTPFESWQQVMDALPHREAAALIDREADYLAAGIVNLTNLVSLDTVLLAGDLQYQAERFTPVLEKAIHHRSIHREVLPIAVRPACPNPDVPLLSAADVAFGRYLTV